MEISYTNNCKNCEFYRESDPLKKQMCDFWVRELKGDVVICVAYKRKESDVGVEDGN